MEKIKKSLAFFKTPRGIFSLLAAAFVLWLIAGLWSPTVQLTRVRQGTAVEAVMGTLKVTAEREVTVKTRVEGRLQSLRALDPSGKLALKEGEAFGQLETTVLDREIELFDSRVRTLKEQISIGSDNEIAIANARNDLSTAEALFKSGQYSTSDLDKRKREVTRLERSWEKEKLDLEKALAEATYELQTRLDRRAKMTFTSPIDGEMCAQYAVEGQFLNVETPVALIRSRQLLMEVELAEEDFPGVKVGQAVTLNFTGLDKNFQGSVSALAAYGNPDTRRRSVFVTLTHPTSAVVPGSTGYATIVKAEHPNALIIPRRALFGGVVYALNWGHLQKRRVQVGLQSLSTVEILDGLPNGKGVALGGGTELKDGLRIKGDWVK